MSAFGGKADIVSGPTHIDSAVTPISPLIIALGVRQDWFRKRKKFCELSCARSTLTNFGPRPSSLGARIPAAARLRDDAQLALLGRWSSSQHLIVGFHARSVTRAQALPTVRQMSWSDDKRRPVSIGPALIQQSDSSKNRRRRRPEVQKNLCEC